MRAAFAIPLLVLVAAVNGPAQEMSRPPQPAASQENTNPQRGAIDPQGQCGWIVNGHLELAPVEKACEAAVAGFDTLPNFVCDLKMTRKELLRRPEKITGELRYFEGEEELKNLTIDGKPAESVPNGGIWSRGEFAPPGLSVLDGRSAPQFSFRGEQKSGDTTLLVFDYKIAKSANRSWTWHIPPYEYRPGFHGELRIEKASGLLRHISLEADDIDSYVPTRSAVVKTDYAPVRIADLGEYLLPLHSEVKSCGRFSHGCSEIVREFVNCRKFAAKAKIIE